MKPEHWQRVEELYHSATALRGHERAEFLARACRQDPDLLDEVQSLLNQGVTATGWLDAPALSMLAKAVSPAGLANSSERPTDAHQLIGKTIGHYHILEEIGAEGMSAVYRAHDHRLRRD